MGGERNFHPWNIDDPNKKNVGHITPKKVFFLFFLSPPNNESKLAKLVKLPTKLTKIDQNRGGENTKIYPKVVTFWHNLPMYLLVGGIKYDQLKYRL